MFLCNSFSIAVRYGRVPKRTREINNSSNVISTTSSCINNINSSGCSSSSNNNNSKSSSICTTTTNTTTTTSPNTLLLDELSSLDSSKVGSEPSTPQMCPVATSPDTMVLSPPCVGGGGGTVVVDHHDLNVYDVILCVSQAHHTYCTYTDEHIRGLTRCPITIPVSESKDDNNVSPQLNYV